MCRGIKSGLFVPELHRQKGLEKCPTGIAGLDEITGGGLPKGRPTLVVGSAGSGKTFLSMEFLVNGATKYNVPGVFVAFEKTVEDQSKGFVQSRTSCEHGSVPGFERFCRAVLRAPDNRIAIWNESYG